VYLLLLTMAENLNNSGWFASVKYLVDEKTEYVPITAISEIGPSSLRTPFQPKHLEDFTPGRIYCVKTKTSSRNGRIHPYNAVIGRLAGKQFWIIFKACTEPLLGLDPRGVQRTMVLKSSACYLETRWLNFCRVILLSLLVFFSLFLFQKKKHHVDV